MSEMTHAEMALMDRVQALKIPRIKENLKIGTSEDAYDNLLGVYLSLRDAPYTEERKKTWLETLDRVLIQLANVSTIIKE